MRAFWWKPRFWRHPLPADGDVLSWDEGLEAFKPAAVVSNGTYPLQTAPVGSEDLPNLYAGTEASAPITVPAGQTVTLRALADGSGEFDGYYPSAGAGDLDWLREGQPNNPAIFVRPALYEAMFMVNLDVGTVDLTDVTAGFAHGGVIDRRQPTSTGQGEGLVVASAAITQAVMGVASVPSIQMSNQGADDIAITYAEIVVRPVLYLGDVIPEA